MEGSGSRVHKNGQLEERVTPKEAHSLVKIIELLLSNNGFLEGRGKISKHGTVSTKHFVSKKCHLLRSALQNYVYTHSLSL